MIRTGCGCRVSLSDHPITQNREISYHLRNRPTRIGYYRYSASKPLMSCTPRSSIMRMWSSGLSPNQPPPGHSGISSIDPRELTTSFGWPPPTRNSPRRENQPRIFLPEIFNPRNKNCSFRASTCPEMSSWGPRETTSSNLLCSSHRSRTEQNLHQQCQQSTMPAPA